MNRSLLRTQFPFACIAVLTFATSLRADEPSREEKLAAKFDALATWLGTQKIRKTSESSKDAKSSGAREKEDLSIQFLLGSTRLENGTDAAALLPVSATSFKRVNDPKKMGPPTTKSERDFPRILVTIPGLLDKNTPKPTAKIRPFRMKDATNFDAKQLTLDKIHEAIHWYLPDVQIEGRQRFQERQLAIRNTTKETVTANVVFRTRERGEKGYEWNWKPFETPGEKSLKVRVSAGKTVLVKGLESEPITASRVRIAVESTSGKRWDTHRNKELWLVAKNSKLEGQRAYYATKPTAHIYVIKPKYDAQEFRQRLLTLKNETDESLSVQLSYLTMSNGQLTWRSKRDLKLPAGSMLRPLGEDGRRIRAMQIRMTATSTNRRFTRFDEKPIHLVKKGPRGRVYASEKIGEFTHSFKASSN